MNEAEVTSELTKEQRMILISDATTFCKELVKSESGVLSQHSDIVTWLVGLGSGGFLLYLNGVDKLSQRINSNEYHTMLIAVPILFVVLVVAAVIFKLTIPRQLRSLHQETFLFDYQFLYLGLYPESINKFMKPEQFTDVLNHVMLKLGLPKPVLESYIHNREVDKALEKLGWVSFTTCLLCFLSEYIVIALLFVAAYL